MKELVSASMLVTDRCMSNEDGVECEVTIEGYVIYHVDTKYGADADGNRGIKKIAVDDVEEILAYDQDGEDVELNKNEEDKAGEILVSKFLEG